MRNEREFGGEALSLYHQYRERVRKVYIQRSTEECKQYVTFSCPPMGHLLSSTQPIPRNFSNLSSKTLQPQRHWQGTNAKKPAKYNGPCRRSRDLRRWMQRRADGHLAQGAGNPLQGAENPAQGAENTWCKEPDTQCKEPDTWRKGADIRCKEPDTGSKELDTQRKEPDTLCNEPDTRCNELDTWFKEPDTQHKEPDTRWDVLDTWRQEPDTWWKEPDTWHKAPDTWCKELKTLRKERDTWRKEPINIPKLDREAPNLDPQGPKHPEDPRYKSCLDSQDI